MAPARRKRRRGETTLVRGPDGALYLLAETELPLKLTENEAHKLTRVLKDAEKKLTDVLKNEIPRCEFGGSNFVRVVVPDVFL
jgi:hypothetical protein